MIVVSIGCPAGVGPEVSVAAVAKLARVRSVLVGDRETLLAAAKLVGVKPGKLTIHDPGPALKARDRKPGVPSRRAGAAQLRWIEAAYDLARSERAALVTGPVSKLAIARSGALGAARFRGHTEWLEERDGAPHSVMCFAAKQLATSLVTTHLPLSRVPRAISIPRVAAATIELASLLTLMGKQQPHVCVASLNPHAGEGELFGGEEARAIVPGIARARRRLGRRARITGPIGAETAYRRALAGDYDGVVAMYHDQATIPTKLVAFGEAVNVTMGLSIVRTSVDHGTGYDIAWQGVADASGMIAAIRLAEKLRRARAR